jgi:hypothetical protein
MEVGLALPLTPSPTAEKAFTVHVARRGTRFCEGHRGSEEKTPHKNTQPASERGIGRDVPGAVSRLLA